MTVHVTADIHFSESDVSHKWHPADDKCHAYGVLKFAFGANLYFQHAGHLDAVIAELVALKQEMAPPVITDSERTCPETHPDSGLPCHRDGDHGVHRDPDGDEWTTDVPNPPHHILPGEQPCTAPGHDDRGVNGSGYVCTAQNGHDGPDHVAYKPGGGEYHRWPVAAVPAPSGMQDPAPVARVITDSERTCPEANPDSGAHCHRGGDHGVHHDTDGKEWRTDGAELPVSERARRGAAKSGFEPVASAAL